MFLYFLLIFVRLVITQLKLGVHFVQVSRGIILMEVHDRTAALCKVLIALAHNVHVKHPGSLHLAGRQKYTEEPQL